MQHFEHMIAQSVEDQTRRQGRGQVSDQVGDCVENQVADWVNNQLKEYKQ